MKRQAWRGTLSRIGILLILFLSFASALSQTLAAHGRGHIIPEFMAADVCAPDMAGAMEAEDSGLARLNQVFSLLKACNACPDILPFQPALASQAIVLAVGALPSPAMRVAAVVTRPQRVTRYARPAGRAPPFFT
jgi:hypothetical protein